MVQKLVAVVDTQFDNKISIGQVNLGDKVNLELEVTMGGEPLVYENPTFNLIAKKSDGTRVRQTEGITLSGGTVIIDCDEQLSTYKGAVSSQLIIKDGDRVSTCIFYFTVGASLEADIIVNSIDKVNTLDDLDELISVGFENLAIFEAKLSEYEVDLGSIIAEESKRITNENLRVTGEADRKASESERITAESVRSASESARVSSEEERIANEMDRVDNEADRRMAENIRKSNEAKREAAEEERANLFELNEEIRKEQEKQRVLNEKRRVEAFDNLEDREGIRLMAEQNRVTAENEREVAEANRRTAELEREAAEENREATYTAFNEAESERVSSEIARKTAEANRVEAEARRVEAESNRDYLYRNAEENRDSSYSTKESNRDSKYAQAEKNRDALFESNEANRKDSYTIAERKRVDNENIRQANEVARDKAEVVRANGELAREGKESARVQAESKRVTAEQSRVTAESKRVIDFEKIKSDNTNLGTTLTKKVDDKLTEIQKDNTTFKQEINEQYEDIVTEFDKVIANVTNGNENATNSEIVQARGKEVNLNARLDNFDEQLDTVDNEVVRLKDFLENSNSGNVSQEDIKAAVNDYLEKKPVQSGATTEQVAQIEANKTAIGDENSGLIKEVNDIKNTELQNLNTAILRVNETVGNKSELPVGDENIIASINRIDNKQFDSVTDEQVSTAVNDYLEKNPVQSGATTEQVAQIEANKTAITNAKIYNANASVPLNLPSYDDALNQATHPKVLYFPDKWNGYKFWCAFTPYCYGQMIHENPCICASNDGLNWVVPQGLKNPIDYPENIDDYLSDTHLVFKDNTLECWYRKVLVDSTGVINKGEVICRKTSTNGVTWSDAEEMYRIDGGASSLLSPMIIWDEDNSLYQIWICAGGVVKYYETPTGKDWSFVRNINISCWHGDIIKSDKGYEFIGYVSNPNKLCYYTSKDNINWSTEKIIMFPKPGNWDSGLYRSSLVIVDGKYYLYYSGTGSDALRTAKAWRVGLSISKDLNIETLEGIKSDYSMNKINVLENYHKTYFGTTEERKKFKPSDSYLYPYKYFDTTLLKELYYYKSKWYDCNANVVAFTDTAPTISTDILDININSGDRAVIPFKAVDDNDIYEFRYYLNIENPDGKNNGISFNPILNFKNEQHLILKGLSDGNYTCVIGARSTYNGNVSWVYSNKFNINVGIPGLNYGSIVLSTSTLDINEGLSNNFTIKLDKAPTESQSVNLTVNNNYCTLDKNSLTFTSSNYNIPQTITVSAIADSSSYSDKSSIITCSSSGTSSKTINVNIKNTDIAPTVAVESVSLDKNSHSLSLNKTVQLNATVLPENATNKNVTWTSNNENCTVINGLVSAKAIGESIITCTTEDGNKTDTCTITVVENTSDGVLRDSSLYLEINDKSISSAYLDKSINTKGTVVLPDQTSNGHDLKLPNTNGAPSYDALSNIICDGKWYSKEISSSLEEYGFQNVDVTFSEGLTLEFRFESTQGGAESLAILRGENTYNGRTLLNIRRMSDNHLNITGNGINLDLTDVIIPNSAHVAVTLSSNGCNVYVDGVNVYTNSVAYASKLFSTAVRRIDHSSNNNSRIVGYNLYRVYTKVLNAEEIQGNYSASILRC